MSTLHTRNVNIDGRRTSVRLEPALWEAFDDLCRRERKNGRTIYSEVAARRKGGGFTSALRVYILAYFRERATAERRAA